MRQTSLQAYHEIREEGLLDARQRLIYDTLKKIQPATALEIAAFLGFRDPNMVRPRINELYKKGVLCEIGVKICTKSGRKSTEWGIKK